MRLLGGGLRLDHAARRDALQLIYVKLRVDRFPADGLVQAELA